GLAVIDPRADAAEETKAFVECTMPIFRKRKEELRLDRGTIDSYLDAKAEGDYLETRGAKLALALETLRFAFESYKSGRNQILSKNEFKRLRLRQLVGNHLEGEIPRSKRDQILAKLPELNRPSF